MTRRYEFVIQNIQLTDNCPPRVLNIGVGDDPVGLRDFAVHLDIDPWRYKYFVQADAGQLPFKDDAFDIIILGDVIEHLVDPLKALKEAKRVGHRLVLTIFEEWRLGEPGQHIEKAGEVFGEPDLSKYIESGRLRGIVDEWRISHNPHINAFSDAMVNELIDALEMRILWYSKEPEWIAPDGHCWYNWLIVTEKEV